jgi:hypothetical protein
MNRVGRLCLIVFAIVLGGISGYVLLPGFEIIKILIFALICLVLGEVFYQIDKRISKK